MSIKLLQRVLSDKIVTGNDRLVLIAIADAANDEGVCYPSFESIREKANVSISSVTRAIKVLSSFGMLLKVNRNRANGSSTSNIYLLFPQENFETLDEMYKDIFADEYDRVFNSENDGQDDTPGVVKVTRGDGQDDTPGVVKVTPLYEPSNKPSVEPKKINKKSSPLKLPMTKPKDFMYPQEFEEIWKVHSNGDKYKAYRAYFEIKDKYQLETLRSALICEKSKEYGVRHTATVFNSDLDDFIEQCKNRQTQEKRSGVLDISKISYDDVVDGARL